MPPSLKSVPPGHDVIAARAAKIDEFGELERKIQLLTPDVARHKVLHGEIQSWAADAPADQPAVARGQVYEVQLSPKRNERTVVKKQAVFNLLKKALGIQGLIAIWDPPLGVIDKNVPASERAKLITEERSGYRTLTVVALQAADASVRPAA